MVLIGVSRSVKGSMKVSRIADAKSKNTSRENASLREPEEKTPPPPVVIVYTITTTRRSKGLRPK